MAKLKFNAHCDEGWEQRLKWAFRYIYKLENSDESAEKLWEDQAWGADVKYTVTEGRQVVGRGYC